MLCRTLRQWAHPDQMLAELSESQYRDWEDVYAVEPWGDEYLNHAMARIVWAIFQKGNRRSLKEDSFLFRFEPAKPPPTPDQYRAKSMAMWAFHAGAIKQ